MLYVSERKYVVVYSGRETRYTFVTLKFQVTVVGDGFEKSILGDGSTGYIDDQACSWQCAKSSKCTN